MRSSHYLLAFLFFCCSLAVRSQDNHFTLHDYNPLWLNPAQTGAYSGSLRVGGIYRGQWYTLNGLSTPSAYVDAPVIKGLRKYDWIGVGANLVSDKAGTTGDLGLKSTFFGFSAAYHLALDDNRRNVFTLGAQYGSTTYSLDVGSATLSQQLTIDPSLGGGGQTQGELKPSNAEGSGSDKSYNDINAGVMLRSVLDPKKSNLLEVGVSVLHLNGPKRGTLLTPSTDTLAVDTTTLGTRAGDNERRRRSTLHGHARLDLELSEKWRFQPSLFVQSSSSVTSASVQAWGSRALKPNLNLRLGLGYRTGDAAQVLIGLDYEQIRAALSYDITLSQSRTVTNYQGAFELSAQYIFNIYKKPTVVPAMLCPRI
ncbi:type IX secretion system PorP/SprF family membrane protein [Lewinella aquimaris]|uniref:Type IX secretion system PorP/SprF family membrane protein n=1 Tax=Neolewinella aquimaris TaxID=1835722 RepID=A0A840E4D0_9BACT|nr:PorP/SprF family type IX secretion system membrane protein [Neolewinella aquimaris]MBB4079930.1 type IX secretion system PorP/SprF family membrane protein [Neolewinella aquimaris]